MIRFRRTLALLCLSGFLASNAPAQSPSPAAETSETSELLALTRKIDAQNTKIDALSQQILRLQQELEHPKATAAGEASSPVPAPAAGGSTHVVARGETLTSIAKLHKVGIDELQKFNHIENDRKLQIGQTLVIPGAPGVAAPSPSPSSAAPNE